MGTCFAFGQTGSGKTFTMLGAPEVGVRGLYLLAAEDMFRLCEHHPEDLGIYVSMMEIYGDEVFDLLSRDKKKLVPREDAKKKVQIVGLTEFAVRSTEELMMAIDDGSQVLFSNYRPPSLPPPPSSIPTTSFPPHLPSR